MAPLEGRVAIVTGANHGIGAATAVRLARLGADVFLTYLRLAARDSTGLPHTYDEERSVGADRVSQAVERLDRRCLTIEADLADPATPAALFDTAEEQLGAVSILVNNASGWRPDTFSSGPTDRLERRLETVSAETFDAQFHIDARAGALLIAEFAVRARRHQLGWGRIVSLTSGGAQGFPGEVSYGAAKAALANYTMSAAAELVADGITANVVHPPITDTGWITEEVRQVAESDNRRVADPAEVAEVIGWLCTDAARLVTGNSIRLR